MRTPWAALAAFADRHLFRVRKGEPLPIQLRHRRIFVLPTRAGVAFAATLATMLVGSMNYGLGLGYGLTFLLTGVGIVSMHHAFRNLIHLQLRAVSLCPAHCGQMAILTASFENCAGRARTALDLFTGDSDAVRFSIEPDSTATVRLSIPARHRGWLEPGRLTLETRYPLGLIRAWSILTPDLRGLVYPAPETPAAELPETGSRANRGHAGTHGRDDFAGLREYQLGDSPRQIAWKSAARDDSTLHTKQFRGGNEAHLEFDWDALPETLEIEARLSRITRWVLDAEAGGLSYGLHLPGIRYPAACGRVHCERCLRALALLGIGDGR